jgi:CHAT domain-containing protein/Tfp pilus assembly protein PilF
MVGDTLLSYDGVTLVSPATLLALEENPASGTPRLPLRVRREGAEITLTVPRGSLGIIASMELPDDVRDIYRQAWMALQAENISESIEQTRSAAQTMLAHGERVTAAWIWWSQGMRFGRAKQWTNAGNMYAEALTLLKDHVDAAARSRALSALGDCKLAQGLSDEAADQWIQAERVDSQAGYQWWEAGDLTQLARVASAKGDLLKAQEYNLKAKLTYEKLSSTSSELARTLNNLGEVKRSLGDLRQAEDLLNASLKMKESFLVGDDPDPSALLSIAGTLSDLGGIALARGDLQSARDYLTRALRTRERFLSDDSEDLAAAMSNLGNVDHEEGNIAAAEEKYRRALAIYQKTAPASAACAGVLGNLGNAAYDRKDLATAESLHRQSIAIFEKVSPGSLDVAKAYHNYGNILIAMSRQETGAQNHLRAKTIYDRLAPESLDLALVLNSMGTVALDQKQYDAAQTLFAQAVGIIEIQRSRIRVTESRAFLVGARMSEYTGLIRAYLGQKAYAHAFEAIERAHARSLAELVFERDFSPTDVPRELLDKQRGITEKRNAAFYRLGVLDPQRDAAIIDQLREQIRHYTVEQRELENQIKQASPRFAQLIYPEPFTVLQVQDVLDPGSVLLTYFVDESETYLFTVTKSGPVSFYQVAVSRSELNNLISTFMMRVGRLGGTGVVQQLSRTLYDLLIKPVRGGIDSAKRLLICPDGVLHKLSFSALELTDGAPGAESGSAERHFLAELKPMHFIVSMGVYNELRRSAAPILLPDPGIVLALGDPAYKSSAAGGQQIVRECGTVRDVLSLLPLTRQQVETIKNLYGDHALVRLGAQASKTTIRNESAKASVIHIASHGFVENCDPLGSFLALTPEEDPSGGLFHAFEIIDSLRLHAALVVLSGCQTGQGEISKSEGVIGLTRAFQYAGARTVLVSLWEITDNSSSDFMKEFYRQYKNGVSKDEALQRAQVAMIRSEFSHPYFWAPFILVGDWK